MLWHWDCSAIAWRWLQCWFVFYVVLLYFFMFVFKACCYCYYHYCYCWVVSLLWVCRTRSAKPKCPYCFMVGWLFGHWLVCWSNLRILVKQWRDRAAFWNSSYSQLGLHCFRIGLSPSAYKGSCAMTSPQTPDNILGFFHTMSLSTSVQLSKFLVTLTLNAWLCLQHMTVLKVSVWPLAKHLLLLHKTVMCTEIKWPDEAGTETGKTTRKSRASRRDDEKSARCCGSRQRVTMICFEALVMTDSCLL